jgi:excisionase family DNA binding protein
MGESDDPLQGPRERHPMKRYYRVDEVAAYFGVCNRTVYRLLDAGDLKGTRIRACIRVSAEEVRRFAG